MNNFHTSTSLINVNCYRGTKTQYKTRFRTRFQHKIEYTLCNKNMNRNKTSTEEGVVEIEDSFYLNLYIYNYQRSFSKINSWNNY